MDFTYDDEQLALREAVRGLLATTYADHDSRRRTVAEDPGFDRALWGRLAEMGVLGLPFSEEHGGVGAGPVEIGIVCRELGRVLAPEPYLASVVHAGGLVAAVGTPAQKADLLGRLSAGELVLAAAGTAPGTGRASGAAGVRASVSGDAWTLDGVADPVVGGESADVLVVTAALPDDAGTGVFLVESGAAAVTGYAAADLTRAASVRFDASDATPLGEPGRDLRASVATIADLTRIMGANQALGVMESQVRATTDYLKSRKQFGVTLNTFQALTFRAADMYVSLELATSVVDWATMTIAGGDRHAVADAADRAGLQVSRAGRHIGQEAIQLHGGIGMTAEYAVGVGTAHLEVLDQWLGNGLHHLSRLSARVTDHDLVEALS
ncbi:acyl-CoA dehydrogenase [Nocardioides flavus (ex Wang et al. 2016)]|uniref:Acyl-CoA dehydrogenase n=1 Tax=Nocardioides flavus (ex Wang et al. 2016) TaxID=2058780 RepID=A0ABQ3HP73_9ACTN|nr:acyl-CoA dehydrogenase family protein [Nocardioides flavus (ex Wang et al. 2016)]GHE19331.1 acyl-CoA dehydrogenase [Nocardioides flavus (ex Wang et al. 2016)]